MDHNQNLIEKLFILNIDSDDENIREYSNIIINRIENPINKIDTICEKHHIIPRCFFDSEELALYEENEVNLTPSEHYLTHYFLFEYYNDERCKSMYRSISLILTKVEKHDYKNYKKCSLLYEESIYKYRECLKNERLDKLIEMFDWIKENGLPSNNKGKSYYNLINNLKRAKSNISNSIFYDEYQDLAESYGYNDIFKTMDINIQNLDKLIEMFEWIKENGIPIKKSIDLEKFYYNKIIDIRNKKLTNKKFSDYEKIAESYGFKDIFKTFTRKDKTLTSIREMFEWIKENGIPIKKSNGIEEKTYYNKIRTIKQSKIGKGGNIYYDEIDILIKEYDFEYIFE